MRLVYVLPFQKMYVPGRSDVTKVLKQALWYEGKGCQRRLVEFHWTAEQQGLYEKIREVCLTHCLSSIRLTCWLWTISGRLTRRRRTATNTP
jgi:hypothetical protein